MKTAQRQERLVDAVLDAMKDQPGALLPILHGVQNALGYVPDAVVPRIAHALNLSRAEVHGVISFYHTFRTRPPGRHVVQICRAESCQAMGSRRLEAYAKERLQVGYHDTTPDGSITLEPVYCLGNCACSPAVRIGDDVFGLVNEERFDELISALEGART